MFGIGFFEIIVIAVVALVVVGPEKFPQLMRQAGRLFVQARRMSQDVRSGFEQIVREAEQDLQQEELDTMRKRLEELMSKQGVEAPLAISGESQGEATLEDGSSAHAAKESTGASGDVGFNREGR